MDTLLIFIVLIERPLHSLEHILAVQKPDSYLCIKPNTFADKLLHYVSVKSRSDCFNLSLSLSLSLSLAHTHRMMLTKVNVYNYMYKRRRNGENVLVVLEIIHLLSIKTPKLAQTLLLLLSFYHCIKPSIHLFTESIFVFNSIQSASLFLLDTV